ncbi:hypothetical protein [Arsenophonus apicola]|uniref:Uncharacterized protein n=1 Tax=Arsenophonus apicola TaxID=2879119 RepID=A0ABY8P4C9_9GAMM|nr:hypothetical protein [Arsenophonus apicola]WGO84348.1 hypothetical protein QG404_05505 [Arsenophonus apicola]
MKSPMQIFIIITLLIFYSLPSYAGFTQCCYGIATAYTVNRLLTSNNKTKAINCNEEPELCTTHPKDNDSTK